MTRKSADERNRWRNELASDLRHIAEEIRPLTDSLDSLHILFQHVWQNRDELFELLGGSPERRTIQCEQCERSAGTADAISDGWKELRKKGGRFVGICPPCDAALEKERALLPAETLYCTCCDAASETSLAKALHAGWQCIVDDEGNERGNYAGMCPACIDEEENIEGQIQEPAMDQAETIKDPGGQKWLF